MEPIPDEVKRFVAERIDSVGQLEVLLLLSSAPVRPWSVSDVRRELRSERSWAEMQLEFLRVEGLLVARGGDELTYAYDPATAELEAIVALLREAHERHRAELIKLVFSQRPSERLRAFSEAFRLRKEQ